MSSTGCGDGRKKNLRLISRQRINPGRLRIEERDSGRRKIRDEKGLSVMKGKLCRFEMKQKRRVIREKAHKAIKMWWSQHQTQSFYQCMKHLLTFKPRMDFQALKQFHLQRSPSLPLAFLDSPTQKPDLFLWAETSAPASVDVISFSSGRLQLSQP